MGTLNPPGAPPKEPFGDVRVFVLRWFYQGQEKACGKCGSCVERLEAFAKVGLTDPVAYV